MGWGYNQHVGDISWGYQECFQNCGLAEAWIIMIHDSWCIMIDNIWWGWLIIQRGGNLWNSRIVQPYNVGLSCGGRSERKTCLWRVVFEIRGDCQQLTWSSTMLYLHPPPVWLKWLKNSCECVCTKNVPTNPQTISPSFGLTWLDTAWRGFHMLRLHSPHHPAVDDHILTDGLWSGAADPSEAATSPGCSADPRGARNERPAP